MNGGAWNIRNRGGGAYNPDCEEHAERMQEEAERLREEEPQFPKPDNRRHYFMAAVYLVITLLVVCWILLGYPGVK